MNRPITAVTRGRAVVIEAAADIRRSAEDVFDYASDPANEPEWNVRAKNVQKLTGGPIGVGARYRMAFTQGPAAISECVRFEPTMCVSAQPAQLAPPSEHTPRRRQDLGRGQPEPGSRSRKPSLNSPVRQGAVAWAPHVERLGSARDGHQTGDVAADCRRRGSAVTVVPADLATVAVARPAQYDLERPLRPVAP